MVILFYGQPASGKTTLADKYVNIYGEFKTIRIDGDKWREVTNNKNYSKDGRIANLKGAFDMALYLEKEGFCPILSFVTPYEELREYLNKNSIKYASIYLFYDGDRGRNDKFANDFEKPSKDSLVINTSHFSIDECILKIDKYVAKKIAY
jgi:adenylylsulfate kinase